MALRDLEADFFVRQCPTIDFADGVFEVTYDVGKARFRFILPPSVFLRALRGGNRCAAQFHEGRGNIVSFPSAGDEPEEEAVAH